MVQLAAPDATMIATGQSLKIVVAQLAMGILFGELLDPLARCRGGIIAVNAVVFRGNPDISDLIAAQSRNKSRRYTQGEAWDSWPRNIGFMHQMKWIGQRTGCTDQRGGGEPQPADILRTTIAPPRQACKMKSRRHFAAGRPRQLSQMQAARHLDRSAVKIGYIGVLGMA